MLILTRRKNEAIRLGKDTRIVLVQVKGNQVRIGIECPSHVKVIREEVFEVGCRENLKSVSDSCDPANSVPDCQARSG